MYLEFVFKEHFGQFRIKVNLKGQFTKFLHLNGLTTVVVRIRAPASSKLPLPQFGPS